MHFDPTTLLDNPPRPPKRPAFLAIVSSAELAHDLLSAGDQGPDGFVVEGPSAGGHNAPPRGRRQFDERGQPIFGLADDVDPSAMQALGRPFWLAGGYSDRPALLEALAAGAAGVQVGTAFAFCEESGVEPELKVRVLQQLAQRQLSVLTDSRASPTGFPFKVLECPGTLTDDELFEARPPICDIGMLRVPFMSKKGGIGYRCPAEPERVYTLKRGRPEHTRGRKCLCNALLANIGLGQTRGSGYRELPLLTCGADLDCVARMLHPGQTSYSAADVIDRLVGRGRSASTDTPWQHAAPG
jgi:NAD(P)H-dependent flavin oxidoreductase YrpB (nitropropane dioxygenase family)